MRVLHQKPQPTGCCSRALPLRSRQANAARPLRAVVHRRVPVIRVLCDLIELVEGPDGRPVHKLAHELTGLVLEPDRHTSRLGHELTQARRAASVIEHIHGLRSGGLVPSTVFVLGGLPSSLGSSVLCHAELVLLCFRGHPTPAIPLARTPGAGPVS